MEHTASHAKPSILLVVCSIGVMAFCVILVSTGLSAFAESWNPCSLIAGAIIFPLFLALGVQQYRGTFRQDAGAAFFAAISLFVVGGCGWITFLNLGIGIGLRWRSEWLGFLLPLVLVSTVLLLAALANLRWARLLRKSQVAPEPIFSRLRFSMRELFLAVTLIAVVAGLTAYGVRTMPPRYAENVAVAEAPYRLPSEAKDVSFCQGHRGTKAYEFSIDEAGFRNWVADGIGSIESSQDDVQIEPIHGSYTIRRYGSLMPIPGSADRNEITITDGLYYDWSKEHRGVYAAFDRTNQRAYYFFHAH